MKLGRCPCSPSDLPFADMKEVVVVPPLLQPNIPRGMERGGHWAFSRCAEVEAELELLLLRSSWMPRVHAHAYASHLMLSGVVHAERGTRALCNVCSRVGAHAGLRQRPPSFAGLVPTYKERGVCGGGASSSTRSRCSWLLTLAPANPGKQSCACRPRWLYHSSVALIRLLDCTAPAAECH